MNYSIADLVQLLRAEGGERLQIQIGRAPVLVIDREDYEVPGPVITEEAADVLLRSVADARHVNELLKRGRTEFAYQLERSRLLVSAIREYGIVRLEFTLVTA